MTQEYFAGRREKYEKPLRLYVVTLALQLLVTPIDAFVKISPADTSGSPGAAAFEAELRAILEVFSARPQLTSMLLVLAGTWALRVAYRKQGIRFAEHFILMLHVGAQGNLIGLALALVPWASHLSSIINGLVFAFALKRVYSERWRPLFWRLFIFSCVGFGVFIAAVLITTIIAMVVVVRSR